MQILPLSGSLHTVNDEYIHLHHDGWICALSDWAIILEKSFPHIKSCGFVLSEDDSATICGALPLCLVKSSLTGKRLVSMPFATRSDPLITGLNDSKELLPILDGLLTTTGAKHIEIRTTSHESGLHLPTGFKVHRVFKCHTIKFDDSITAIHKRLHRTSVRPYTDRAADSGVTIRKLQKIEDIRLFYRLYLMTRKRLFLPAIPISFFEEIWKAFSGVRYVVFLIAEINGLPAASIMLFMFGNRVSAEAMGWDPRFSKEHIVTFLYWESIKFAFGEGYTMFDFGRTDPSNLKLMDFKSHWGTEVSDLPIYFLYQKMQQETARKLMSNRNSLLLRRAIFGLPSPIYKIISTLCYRHMG